MENHEKIASPLTSMLKNNAFIWNEVSEEAFTTLKYVMWTTPFLAMFDFSKTYVLIF